MTQPQAQESGPRPLPTATFTAPLPDFGDPAGDAPPTDNSGGGGGPPDDDDPVLMHDDLRRVAWDVQAARDGLGTLTELLRDAGSLDTASVRGLVVLLEGPYARLDVAMTSLAEIAAECRVEGIYSRGS